MGNHCIYTVCSCCGHEYCVRCEFGICPKCGTPWNAKPVSVDEFIGNKKSTGEIEMTTDEIYQATLLFTKKEKLSLVNRILATLNKDLKPEGKIGDQTMPVHQAMTVFDRFVFNHKGVRYSPNGKFSARDYGYMRSLLAKLEARMCEAGVSFIDDAKRIETFESFLNAVKEMRNTWYYDNRFTPYGLDSDFQKIYISLQTQRNHGQQTAFKYL